MRAHDKLEGNDPPARNVRRITTSATNTPVTEHPVHPSPATLLTLQSTIGNAAVARMLTEGHELVQRTAVHEVLRSPGQPLDEPTRTEMEARLNSDFSDVRLHTGPDARQSATEIGARAYTSGHHVVIGEGGANKHTLAHELTHVMQQRSGPVAGTDTGTGLQLSDPNDRFERAAEENAKAALRAPIPQESVQKAASAGHGSPSQLVAQRAAATEETTSSQQPAALNPVFEKGMGPNPMLWTNGNGNYWVGTGAPPANYLIDIDQHCAYMAVYWLCNGHNEAGLRFLDFNEQTRIDASTTVLQWASEGGLDAQKGYALARLGGHQVSLQILDSDVAAGTLPPGTLIWFGDDRHAEAAVVTGTDTFLMYDPNTGATKTRDGKGFSAYIKAKNVFVVKPGPDADPQTCGCCAVM